MTECIETPNKRNRDGYGATTAIRYGRRIYLSHVLAWVDANGRLPADCVLHTCDNPPCVNPDHLYDGTHAQNVADKMARGRWRNGREVQTHCKRGHEFTPENTRQRTREASSQYAGNAYRSCKECHG